MNNALISQKIEKNEKEIHEFFEKFRSITDEVNGIGAIRKQLTLLITP